MMKQIKVNPWKVKRGDSLQIGNFRIEIVKNDMVGNQEEDEITFNVYNTE